MMAQFDNAYVGHSSSKSWVDFDRDINPLRLLKPGLLLIKCWDVAM